MLPALRPRLSSCQSCFTPSSSCHASQFLHLCVVAHTCFSCLSCFTPSCCHPSHLLPACHAPHPLPLVMPHTIFICHASALLPVMLHISFSCLSCFFFWCSIGGRLVRQFTELRQSCCHPQIVRACDSMLGGKGGARLSMQDIMARLTAKAYMEYDQTARAHAIARLLQEAVAVPHGHKPGAALPPPRVKFCATLRFPCMHPRSLLCMHACMDFSVLGSVT